MAEKIFNTINQNIEPHAGKLINTYFKQFGTLLNQNAITRNDLSQIPIPTNYAMIQDNSNVSVGAFDDADAEFTFHEVLEEPGYMDPNSVWDRGKLENVHRSTPDDRTCLRRLESTVTHLETCLEPLPNDASLTSQNTRSLTIFCPSNIDDTLSDVDLDKFDTNGPSREPSTRNQLESISSAIERAETASLSDFHNVRDVLLNIQERLETFLQGNRNGELPPASTANPVGLEGNIADLKTELERYVHILNERKENELRKFSENMMNRSNVVQMKKAFTRKEKLQSNIYETLSSNVHNKYAIANSESLPPSVKYFTDTMNEGFTMRKNSNNYNDEYCYSEPSSVEYYSMLISEERTEKLLNDAPPPQPRYFERDKISLIFRDPENVIKQWQNYQLKTIQIKPKKKERSLNFKWKKGYSGKPHDVWGFTMDKHQSRVLQVKLEKERQLRLLCRTFFYFFSVVCFVLIVLCVQSFFNFKKRI